MNQNPSRRVEADLLTVEEMASFLKVSPKTIYDWVPKSEIPFIKVGRLVRFSSREVLEHFLRRTEERRPKPELSRNTWEVHSSRRGSRF